MGAQLNWILAFLYSLFAFIIILVPLVVFHEFGHFIFARIFGVKAEIFSVGFGPRLFSKQIGETEFRVSAIPLGGYVKLLGEDREAELSEQDKGRALHLQKPWKRFFIFFGGPLFNFILAIFIFMAILVIGEPQIANVIGRVVHSSSAEKAGLLSGDRVLFIDGKPIKRFEEIIVAMSDHPGGKLKFTVQHPHAASAIELNVPTSVQSGYSVYGETTPVGEIDGLYPAARSNHAGVSNPQSIAGQAGLQTGDRVLQFNEHPVLNWEQIEVAFQEVQPGTSFSIQFQKKNSNDVKTVHWLKPVDSRSLAEAFGLYSSELFVDKAVPKSPAASAGVQSGDRLVQVGQQKINSFFELKEAVQKSGEKDGKVELTWERGGVLKTSSIIPTATTGRDPILNKMTQYTVGVIPMMVLAEPETFLERTLNPIKLVYVATQRMITFSWRNLVSLKKVATGDVSVGTLGGPIMIGKIAGESLARGVVVFLTNMAIFSIGLGVLNILPVPILDGGHLMLLSVEMIRGKPLTLKQMEVLQGVGLIFILALMGIAFHNDISRLIYS